MTNNIKFVPTFKFHSDVQTFLESAVWASFPLCLVDDAAPISHASIDLFILNSAFEEAFAALACEESIMVATNLVATYRTQLFHSIFSVRLVALPDAAPVLC